MIARYPKPHILEQLRARAHGIIEASAGTGKTFTLEHLIVDVLLRHEHLSLDNILVVTFTERATAELKVRVRRLLSNIVGATRALELSGADSKEEEVFDVANILPGQPFWEITVEDRRRLERALFSFDVAPIYTIHGFCQRVLTEYAFANQRAFDQHHVEFPMLFDRAFRDAMRRSLSTDDDTRDWLEAWLEAGTVDELQVMLSRVVVMRAEIWPRLRHDPLVALMREFGPRFWHMYRTLYTKRCVKRERVFLRAQEAYVQTGSVARFLMLADSEVIDLKASLRNCVCETPEQERFLELIVKLLRFKPAVAQKFLPIMLQAIAREKERTGSYTYDDMLSMVWESLEGPNGKWLAGALRRKYTYALIDEFQDTDELQWMIFERLFHEPEKSHGLYVIGDPKQAIYAFRGADVHTYLRACEVMLGAGDERPCDRVHLEENYRSTSALIDAYNVILDQSAKPAFFSGKKIRYTHPVRCGDETIRLHDASHHEVAPVVVGSMKRKEGDEGSARMDDIYECYGRWVAHKVHHILSPEGGLFVTKGDEEPRRVGAKDIFILTRSHADERRLERYLREVGVPYALYKQEGLFQTHEAWMIYELMRAIERPHDRGLRLKAWSSPFFGVEFEDLIALRELSETHPLYRTLLDWTTLARQQSYEELFSSMLQSSGLVRREIFFHEDARGLTHVQHILEVLLEEAHLARLDFSELVSRLKSFIDGRRKPLGVEGNVKRLEHERDAVQLMTMHKAKGLEADVVFVYAFGGFSGEFWPFHYTKKDGEPQRALHILKPEGRISPKLRIRVEEESREEDERLLYVALTRARARMYLPFVPYAGSQPMCRTIASRCYHVVNSKLCDIVQLVQQGDERIASLFELEDIPYFGLRHGTRQESCAKPDVLTSWEPPMTLFGDDDALARVHKDRAILAGRTLRMESYTSLKRKLGGYHLAPAPWSEEELLIDDQIGAASALVSTKELPGGVGTGKFLHEVLELLDYGTLTRHKDFERWAADPQVVERFERSMLEHGLEDEHLEQSQRIVYRALSATVPMETGVIYGLGWCPVNVRELEFMYPIPESRHARFGTDWEEPVQLERGFIKGYIDYVFEWRDRVYFVDWKSDILERYDAASLKQHFEQNYAQQALLYGLALCKMIGLVDETSYEARFGGAVYVFLRGIGEDGAQGVIDVRPSWQELCGFDQDMSAPGLAHAGLKGSKKR